MKFVQQAGLADAGFAAEEHGLAASFLDLRKQVLEQRDFPGA